MKKFIVVLFFIMPGFLLADNGNDLKAFFEKYSGNKDFTYINLSPKLFQMFASEEMTDEEDDEFMNLISSISSLKVLAVDSSSQSQKYFSEAKSLIDEKYFEELAYIRNADENVQILIRETNSKINEMLVMVQGNHNFVLIDLQGDIDLKDVQKMSKFNMKGMKYLKNAKEE